LAAGLDLEQAHRGFPVQDLALQVGAVNGVTVGQQQSADPCCCQIEHCWRTQTSGPHHQHGGIEQPLLAFDTDLVEQQVAAIAQEQVVVQGQARMVGLARHRRAAARCASRITWPWCRRRVLAQSPRAA
jgi:hypothetical protein